MWGKLFISQIYYMSAINKKTILTLAFVGLAVVTPTFVRAAEDRADRMEERQAKLSEKKAEREAKLSERKEKIEEKRVEREKKLGEKKLKLEEKRKEKVAKLGEKTGTVLTKLADKVEKVGERVRTALTKAEARGKDISKGTASLKIGDDKLKEAQDAIEKLSSSIDELIAGEFTQKELKELVGPIREDIKAAKKAYGDALRAVMSSKSSSSDDDSEVETENEVEND